MNCFELLQLIERGEIPSAVRIGGDDEYWRKKAKDALIALCDPFDLTVFENVDLSEVVFALGSIPMLGARRVVVVRGLTKSDKKTLELFKSYIKDPNPTSVLVLDCKCDFDFIPEVVCDRVYGTHLTDEIENIFASFGRSVEKSAIDLLIEYCESDMTRIYSEICKLTAYSLGTVIKADIEECVEPSVTYKAYNFVNYIVNGDYVSCYDFVAKSKDKLTSFLGMLIRTYRLAFYSKSHNYNELAKLFDVPVFTAKNAKKVADRYLAVQLYKIISFLYDLEYKLKTGAINEETALPLMLAETIERRNK